MFSILKLFAMITISYHVAAFQQYNYRLIHEKIVIDDYNKEIIEDPVIALFKYNKTSSAFNATVTVKQDLNDKLYSHTTIRQSVNGTYRLIPGKFILNICEIQARDTFGTRDIYLYGNATDCPIKKGTYYVSNYNPDERKFPHLVPKGKLIVESKMYHGDVYLGSSRWYGTVEMLNEI